MGCLHSTRNVTRRKSQEENKCEKKTYSWDKRRADEDFDLSNYIIENRTQEICGKLPGSLNGEQLVIQNCVESTIYVFDHTATITVENCENCAFFIAPVKGSIFVRNSRNCTLAVSCGQFRSRDCHNLNLFLFCKTQPVIEASAGLKFACLQCCYNGFEEHMTKASLNPFENKWSSVYDFSSDSSERNYKLLQKDELPIEKFISIPQSEPFDKMNLSFNPALSAFPWTAGHTNLPTSEETCFMIFFSDKSFLSAATKFTKDFLGIEGSFLFQTASVAITPDQVESLLNSSHYNDAATNGEVIGIHGAGKGSNEFCKNWIKQSGDSMSVFCAEHSNQADQLAKEFFALTDDCKMGM